MFTVGLTYQRIAEIKWGEPETETRPLPLLLMETTFTTVDIWLPDLISRLSNIQIATSGPR